MTQLISYPFRLDGRGYAVTKDDRSDGYYAEELSNLIQTEPGERVLAPMYGIEDPSFRDVFPTIELKAKVNVFGPPVDIHDVKTSFRHEGIADVLVEFDRRLN